jgi:hypothetical protein
MDWRDPNDPMLQEVLYFEKLELVHKRYHTTAWLPYDPEYCSELYKFIITQLKFVRSVIDDQHSFGIKRSKQAANALDLSSHSTADIEGAKEVLGELANFRIKSPAYKYKGQHKSGYVVSLVSKYAGVDILGTNQASARDGEPVAGGGFRKNFVVTVGNTFGIKIFVAFDADTKETVRVTFVGKPASISLAGNSLNRRLDSPLVGYAIRALLDADGELIRGNIDPTATMLSYYEAAIFKVLGTSLQDPT